MIILRRLWCSPCPIRTSNVSSPSGVVFAAFFGGFRSSTMTYPVTLGRFFSLHEAFSGTIVMPYVLSTGMLLVHIRMLSFTFSLPVASAISLSVRRTRPASTGFHHVRASCGPDCLNKRLYWLLESGFGSATFQRSGPSPLLTRSHCGPPFCFLIRRSGHILPAHPFSRSFIPWILALFHHYFLPADV
jgi:hypothetical protein